MVQDPGSADEIERRVGQLEVLGVHLQHVDVQALGRGVPLRGGDGDRRDVDRRDVRARARQLERRAPGAAPVFEDAAPAGTSSRERYASGLDATA